MKEMVVVMRGPSRIPVIIKKIREVESPTEGVSRDDGSCNRVLCESRVLCETRVRKAYDRVAELFGGDCFFVEDDEFVPLLLDELKAIKFCSGLRNCEDTSGDTHTAAGTREDGLDFISEVEREWVASPDLRLAQLLYVLFLSAKELQ